jgi:hypothetical protein
MSGSASQGLEQQLLQHTLAIAPMAALTRVYVALCGSAPSEDTGGTEVSGGGYARVAATFSLLSATGAANAAAIEFPAATTNWGAVGYFEIWSAATGGDRLYWGPLVDPADGTTPLLLTVAAGDIVRFPVGMLLVQAAEQPELTTGGPFLPLTGGNVTGPTVFSAAGTGLSVTAGNLVASRTIGTGLGSDVMLQLGDTVTANSNPILVSYKVGASSGAVTSIGFNSYINAPGAGGQRLNTAKNGWSVQHDTRAAAEGDFVLGVTSSLGATTVPFTFGASGLFTIGNVATTSAITAPRYFSNRTVSYASATTDQIAYLQASLSGTFTGAASNVLSPFVTSINADTVNAGSTGVVRGAYNQHLFGGATVTGHREAQHIHLNMTAKTANNSSGIFYVGQNITVNALDNDNGTAATSKSNLFGFNYIATLGPAATYWNSVVGGEIDVVAKAGSSVSYKCILNLVNWVADAVQGLFQDCFISLGRHSVATVGMKMGIEYGGPGGWWPIDPAGVMIGCGALYAGGPARQASVGIDFSTVTFATAFLKSVGFTVDGAGVVTAAAVQTGTATGPTWTTGTAAPTATTPIGSLYSRVGGAVGATLYVSRGSGTWAAVAGV